MGLSLHGGADFGAGEQIFFERVGYLFRLCVSMGNQPIKINIMNIAKFGAIALTLGLFAASCNNDSTTTETKTTDSAAMVAPAPAPAPVTTTTTSTDTAVLAPNAGTDTTKMKMETKKTETKEVKH
jgi:hypothetical protein